MGVFKNIWRKVFLLVLSVFVFSTTSYTMQRDISVDYLVENSDVIAVVDVMAVKKVGTVPLGWQVVANLVQVNQTIKGRLAVGERLKIKTRTVEDSASLKAGQKTLLFLKSVDKYYEVVGGLAGSWPLNPKDESLLGFGTGLKISDIEEAVKKAKIPSKPVNIKYKDISI